MDAFKPIHLSYLKCLFTTLEHVYLFHEVPLLRNDNLAWFPAGRFSNKAQSQMVQSLAHSVAHTHVWKRNFCNFFFPKLL